MLTNYKRIITFVVIFSLIFTYIALPNSSNAASLTAVSVTLSDSDVSVAATSTIAFTIGTTIATSSYIEVVYPGTFGGVATSSIDCSGVDSNAIPSVTAVNTARCTASSTRATSSALTIIIGNVNNPSSAGSKTITINTYDSGDTLLDSGDGMVAIIDSVSVSASVPATLTFTISDVVTSTVINTATTTGATATTSIEFGEIQPGSATAKVMGQELRVTTNASAGYSVTVEQSGNLSNGGSSDIDSFIDGTASTTAQAWASPTSNLADEKTWGHFGVTTNDTDLSALSFGSGEWKGFNGTTGMEVMYHTGPADGDTQDIGLAQVAYKIEVSALQEAGDYTNSLTYICTPTY